MNAETMAEAMFPESETTYDYQAVREAFEYGFAAAQQCLPTVEEVRDAIAAAYPTTAKARAVLALFAAQPTVREAKAEGWDEGRESVFVDMAQPLDHNMMRPSTTNPYRSEADYSEELLDEAEHERSRQEGCHG